MAEARIGSSSEGWGLLPAVQQVRESVNVAATFMEESAQRVAKAESRAQELEEQLESALPGLEDRVDLLERNKKIEEELAQEETFRKVACESLRAQVEELRREILAEPNSSPQAFEEALKRKAELVATRDSLNEKLRQLETRLVASKGAPLPTTQVLSKEEQSKIEELQKRLKDVEAQPKQVVQVSALEVDASTKGLAPRGSDGGYDWLRKLNDEPHRAARRDIAELTGRAVRCCGYTFGSSQIVALHPEDMLKGTLLVSPTKGTWPRPPPVKITQSKGLVFQEAAKLALEGKRVAAVGAASAYHAGGGFVTGGRHALEEAMCVQSTLYESLLKGVEIAKDARVMPPDWVQQRGWEQHIPDDGVLISPKVEIFRQGSGEGYEFMDVPAMLEAVISVAMPNRNPEIRDSPIDAHPDSDMYKQQLKRKWRAVLTAAASYTTARTLVVPDAGCGVFRNDPQEVGVAFGEVLREEFATCFDEIVITGSYRFFQAVSECQVRSQEQEPAQSLTSPTNLEKRLQGEVASREADLKKRLQEEFGAREAELKKRLQEEAATRDSLQKSLAASNKLEAELVASRDAQVAKIEELQKRLKDEQSAKIEICQNLQGQLDEQGAINKDLCKQLDELNVASQSSGVDNEETHTQIQLLMKDLSSLRVQSAELERVAGKVPDLEKKCREQQDDIQRLQTALEGEKQAKVRNDTSQGEALGRAIEAEDKLVKATAELSSVTAELSNVQRHAASLEQGVRAATTLQEVTEKKAEALVQERDRLDFELNELKSQAQATARKSENCQSELELRLKASEADVQRLTKEIASMPPPQDESRRAAKDQELINRLNAEKNELNSQLAQTWAKINEQTKKIEDERQSFWDELQSRVSGQAGSPNSTNFAGATQSATSLSAVPGPTRNTASQQNLARNTAAASQAAAPLQIRQPMSSRNSHGAGTLGARTPTLPGTQPAAPGSANIPPSAAATRPEIVREVVRPAAKAAQVSTQPNTRGVGVYGARQLGR